MPRQHWSARSNQANGRYEYRQSLTPNWCDVDMQGEPTKQQCDEYIYERAVEIARQRNKISAMIIQKRLGCPIIQCAEMMRRMEKEGVVKKSRLAVKRVLFDNFVKA